jgi:hypothetical protein
LIPVCHSNLQWDLEEAFIAEVGMAGVGEDSITVQILLFLSRNPDIFYLLYC